MRHTPRLSQLLNWATRQGQGDKPGRAPGRLDGGQAFAAVLNDWRSKTVNSVLTIVAVLGFVSVVSLFAGASGESGQRPAALFFLGTYLLILVLAFYRRVHWRLRGWGFLVLVYLIGITSLARGGLAGAGREYLIIIPILATILIGTGAGMATTLISLLVMAAFAFIADAGYLRGLLIYEQNPVDLASWAEEIAYTAVLMGVGTALLILFNRYLLSMLKAERQASQEVEAAHARLAEYNATLEEKVSQRTAELAQAYRAEAQTNKRLEKELALAGSIQASFMSQELPEMAGWQRAARLIPARQTSGDFYDLYPLGKGRYGLLIADVVDKGVGAALVMALCWALFHIYTLQHRDHPQIVMRKVNDRLIRYAHSDQFVTVFYGVLDTRRNRLAYCNAGHNPPYVFGPSQAQAAEALKRTGLPLGILPGQAWEVGTVRFHPGDLLVLYTDGVTEAENGCQEFFGSERLAGVIGANLGRSAADIQQAIIGSLGDFAGGRAQCDDITLMVLACQAPPSAAGSTRPAARPGAARLSAQPG